MPRPSFDLPNIVLLAAGSGRRMLPLTADRPKALLPIGGRAVIDWMIEALRARSDARIVVVTGFGADAVGRHLRHRHGAGIAAAYNAHFADDTNILSVETGVAALDHSERGYLVCETDLLLDTRAWDALASGIDPDRSQWICRGRYGRTLTGGAVRAAADGRIDAIDYQPRHDARCDGWDKMLGMLWVAPRQVAADRAMRRAAIDRSLAQYYLAPWRAHREELPCTALRVEAGLAVTFNTPAEFARAGTEFLAAAAAPLPARTT